MERFFNDKFILKKLQAAGSVRRYTATATTDGHIQVDSRRTPDQGLNSITNYYAVGSGNISDYKIGRLIESQNTGLQYQVNKADLASNPITGTEYIELELILDTSKQNGSVNQI